MLPLCPVVAFFPSKGKKGGEIKLLSFQSQGENTPLSPELHTPTSVIQWKGIPQKSKLSCEDKIRDEDPD